MASHSSLKSDETDCYQNERRKQIRKEKRRPKKIEKLSKHKKHASKRHDIVKCKRHPPKPKRLNEESTKGNTNTTPKEAPGKQIKQEQNKMTAEEARKIWQAFKDSEERILNDTASECMGLY